MLKLILLLLIGVAAIYLYPRRHEAVDTACAALQKRIIATLPATTDPRIAREITGLSQEALVNAAARMNLPFLSPEEGCVVAYWITLFHLDPTAIKPPGG